MRFGILERYVAGEVLRSFLMALLTITIVFVLFIVMTEATRMGLSPREILSLIPCVIPGSLPYTTPVSMLFAVTVVYGRLAGDNEVVAVKTAGLSAWTVLWPSMALGGVVSGSLVVASTHAIPTANIAMQKVIFKTFEDAFYRYLKKDRESNIRDSDFTIKVDDVVERELINATIKHKAPRESKPKLGPNGEIEQAAFYDLIVVAEKARIQIDPAHDQLHIYLDNSDIQQGSQSNAFVINDSVIDVPLPESFKRPIPKFLNQMTDREIVAAQADYREKMALERKRQAFAAALWIGSGQAERVDWKTFEAAFVDYQFWEQRTNEFETERQQRTAMAFGSLFFTFLGAPVGIFFARRDFLSAFITCFLPIILVYYPLMLGGVNLGKQGMIPPILALWAGNIVLFTLGLAVLRPVLKH